MNLPNQELSVLFGGPTLNYGIQLSLYFPHILRVNMTRDLAHLQLSDLQGEIRPTGRTSDLQPNQLSGAKSELPGGNGGRMFIS